MQAVKNIIPRNIKNIYHFFQAIFAVLYYHYPARKLKVIAVTGTDGKTTTSTLIHHVLTSSGKRVALISTVAAKIGDKNIDVGLHVTLPNPLLLQRIISEIVDKRYEYLVIEVTSHGIDQHRTLGLNVTYCVLTNITREHLDYHGTFEHYLLTKVRLLKSAKVAFLNKDDVSYKKVLRLISPKVKIVKYDTDIFKKNIKKSVYTHFKEKFNRLNSSAAYSVCKELGVNDRDFIKAIKSFPGVVGRMDRVSNRRGINIIIDFAHTPNALENVLTELRNDKKKSSRLISVFGCAGERDRSKREEMGKISGELADISVLTAEDPRSEDVDYIIDSIADGASSNAREIIKTKKLYVNGKNSDHVFMKVPERGKAIFYAINKIAKKGDIIVICGKGHEKSMAYNGVEYPWLDHEAVELALAGKEMKINYER